MTKLLILVFLLMFAIVDRDAHAATWQPSPGHKQISIWHGKVPDAEPVLGPEKVETSTLKNAGVPAEMHLYSQGGHAFGLRHTALPITDWPRLVDTWLRTIGEISQ